MQRDLRLWGVHVHGPVHGRIGALGAGEGTGVVLRLIGS